MTEMDMQASSEAEVARATERVAQMREQISRVVIGQRDEVDQVLLAFLAAGHVLIEGVPGLGKTLLVLALARTFGGKFSRVQFTPDLMPSDVTGHVVFDGGSNSFRLRRGPAFTNLLLADEINRASAKTQAALLEVMQEGQITIEGEASKLAPPFMTLATQNPIEQEGTYPLPEAQLDRFLLKIVVDYPSLEEESRIVELVTTGHVGDQLEVSSVERVMSPEDVLELQRVVARSMVVPRVREYAVRIVRETRTWRGVAMGAGPRGGIALIRVARARALLEGRGFVTPDDVKSVALPVLRHRLTLAPELELEGVTSDSVLGSILQKVEAPRE
ncbi:MAG: MoxR family ATPase [Planctomycetes bacterium]|nr:MoxR family ATPase [Planctomycetota bacterium]